MVSDMEKFILEDLLGKLRKSSMQSCQMYPKSNVVSIEKAGKYVKKSYNLGMMSGVSYDIDSSSRGVSFMSANDLIDDIKSKSMTSLDIPVLVDGKLADRVSLKKIGDNYFINITSKH